MGSKQPSHGHMIHRGEHQSVSEKASSSTHPVLGQYRHTHSDTVEDVMQSMVIMRRKDTPAYRTLGSLGPELRVPRSAVRGPCCLRQWPPPLVS